MLRFLSATALLIVCAQGCGSDPKIVDRSTLEVSPTIAKGVSACKIPMASGPALEVQIDGLKQLSLEEICDRVRGLGAKLEPGIRYLDTPRERTLWDIDSALQILYMGRGYLSARVDLQPLDRGTNRIRIEEGARYRILSFQIENDDPDTGRQLKLLSRNKAAYETMIGTWVSRSAVYQAIEDLREQLRREGYGYAEIRPRTDLEGSGVHITLQVNRGRRNVSSLQKPVCGNGLVEPPETCDTAIKSGRNGTCDIACSNQDPCMVAILMTDEACQVSCKRSPIDCSTTPAE